MEAAGPLEEHCQHESVVWIGKENANGIGKLDELTTQHLVRFGMPPR